MTRQGAGEVPETPSAATEPLAPPTALDESAGWLDEVVDIDELEPLARARMAPAEFDYVAGGSWDEVTLADNIAAFRRRRLVPRVLADVSSIDLSTRILGTPVTMPIGVAPTAFQAYAHRDAEVATARAASAAGALFCLSTMSSRSMEEVAAAADDAGDGPRWFQLYVHRDRSVSRDLVTRAAASGYGAVVLTVDLPVAGHRRRDARNRLPDPGRYGNFAAPPRPGTLIRSPLAGFNDAALTWDDVAWIGGIADLPLVIKGILAPDDAVRAVRHGARGIVVSNHGGRQLDRAIASIDALERIVDAVGGRAEVYLDGGVRRGMDVATALALGATAVFVGRPVVYGLAAAGEPGVARVLALLRHELEVTIALLGVTTPSRLRRRHIAP